MDFHHERISTGMSFEGFIRVIYPKQDKYRIAAAWFLKTIQEKKGADGYDIARLCKEKGIPKATMHKVFKRLRSLGLVERRQMKYYLNTEFSTAVRRLGEAWKTLANNKVIEFDEQKLSINL